MANVTSKVATIRNAKYGNEVREGIASGIENINTEVVSTTGKQEVLETVFNGLVINAGSDNAEIVVARGIEDSLPIRLNKFDSSLADKALQTDLDNTNIIKANITYVNDKVSAIDRGIGGTKTLAQIQALPSDTLRYVASDNGLWYYHNGTTWISGGTFQGLGIAVKSINYNKTDFFALDTVLNMFNGTYINKNLMGSSPNITLSDATGGRVAVIPILPNTTYSIIKDSSDRFKFATDTILGRANGMGMNGGIQWSTVSPTTTKNYTFTSGASDIVLYVDVTSLSQNVFLQVIKGTQSTFTLSEYPVKPNGLFIYAKDEVYSKAEVTGLISVSKNGIYIDAKADRVLFYIPTTKADTYLGYNFQHIIRPYVNGGLYQNDNQWRLIGITEFKVINGVFIANKAYQYIQNGEIECAISVSGTADFCGGFHGYELMENGYMLIDGIYKTLGTVYNGWCESLTLGQNSNILKQGTVSEQICHHSKYYEIDTNGIRIKQKVKWLQAISINSNYMGMLPIKRTSDDTVNGIQITDHFFSTYDNTIYDVTLVNHAHTEKRLNTKTARIWGNTSGVSALMTVTSREDKQGYFFCQDTASYNKLYFSYTKENYTTTLNELWENEIFLKVDVV